jgi:branched-chain amino acid transport system substrate-binding protein
MFSSPAFFPSGTALPAEFYGMIAAAKQQGITKIGTFYCAEAPSCAQVPLLMGAIGSQVVGGVKLVNSQKISATAPSFAAPCLAAKQAGVQAVFTAESPAVGARVLAGCAQQGYKPRLIGINGVIPVSAAASGNYEGAIIAHGNLPPDNTGTPGAQALHAALDKYAPGITKSEFWSSNPTDTWMGLALFAKAAQAGKLTPSSTPADVTTALYALQNETLDGLAGPLNYTKGKPTLAACPFVETVKNRQWVSNTKPACVPPAQLALLGKILAASAGH